MRIGRDLLVEVRLARAAWTQLDDVVVAFDERDHAQQQDGLSTWRQLIWLKADAPQQQVLPLFRRELCATAGEILKRTPFRELNRPQRRDAERASPVLLRGDGVILERDFGVETPGEQTLVRRDQIVGRCGRRRAEGSAASPGRSRFSSPGAR